MTSAPWWAALLVRSLAPRDHVDDVLGDLEEAHRSRAGRHGPIAARALTTLDAVDMAAALIRSRCDRLRTNTGNSMIQDYKLGLRMLVKYPGLTIAGGLALAIAIGIGAGWYDLSRDLLHPKLPLPDADRIVEIEMRDAAASGEERRLLHDFTEWRREIRTVEALGAYRTVERNLALGDARPEPVTAAEITASAFRLAAVPPLVGRTLLDSDEQPGAPAVVVLGYTVWQQRFGGRSDIAGQTVRLGRTTTTVVGVMPEGFAFPVNHRLWVPLPLRVSGYQPLEGPPIRIFGRIAPGSTQAQANAELVTIVDRARAGSPKTYEHLRPRVLAYGGESPGDRSWFELMLTHLPVVLVLIIACANVGTLIYARTATREAEIAIRYSLGASRGRIVGQLFIEALVLSSVAAIAGLTFANWALRRGMDAYFSGQPGGPPFWINPGLKLTTMLYAAGLTVIGGAILGVLPAIKATRSHPHGQLRNLGSGGSTLRFGWIWTTVMIGQVALTLILLPPAMGITQESLRDRAIRGRFPAGEYLAVQIELDREGVIDESDAEFAARLDRTYREFARQLQRQPEVVAVTFADRLPGMGPSVREAQVEPAPGAEPVNVANMWTAAVGPQFFETFGVPLVAGRDFHDTDRGTAARTVLVNEAFARRYMNGASPVGRRVRYTAANASNPEPWLEIVGMVRDVGMTPTDLGEAPYVFQPAAPATVRPLVMGVRVAGDPEMFAPRVRSIASQLDAGLRLDEVRSLDDLAWRVDLPQMIAAAALASIVSLGLFLSSAGIFSLMSVSVARRTREIGLRSALGASRPRLLAGIFTRALVLVGSGVAAGNGVLLLFITLTAEVDLSDVGVALIGTSALMLTVGLLGCVEPARRALRIHPTDALRES
jgi:putative ABC transport system permease protein